MAYVAEESTRFLYYACQKATNRTIHSSPIEDALAHFGSNLLCPTADAEQACDAGFGQVLYAAYLEGRITKPGLRRIFLAHGEDRGEALELIAQIAIEKR